MSRSTVRCSNIIELGKYLRISYDKAMDIANIPSFPKAIFINGKPFPKAEIVAWAAQRLGPTLFESNATVNATDNATRVIIGKKHNKIRKGTGMTDA